MDFITKLKTMFFYNFIGEDQFGNKYYEQKPRNNLRSVKRIVKYKGLPEASKVPPGWHGWLHHNTKNIPNNEKDESYYWQKQHVPNLSGTIHSKLPTKFFEKNQNTSDPQYYAWIPESKSGSENE